MWPFGKLCFANKEEDCLLAQLEESRGSRSRVEMACCVRRDCPTPHNEAGSRSSDAQARAEPPAWVWLPPPPPPPRVAAANSRYAAATAVAPDDGGDAAESPSPTETGPSAVAEAVVAEEEEEAAEVEAAAEEE